MPISRLVRRVDVITEGYSVMGSYVRTGPRAFQQFPLTAGLVTLTFKMKTYAELPTMSVDGMPFPWYTFVLMDVRRRKPGGT